MYRNENATTIFADTTRYESRAAYGDIIKPEVKMSKETTLGLITEDFSPTENYIHRQVNPKAKLSKRKSIYTTFFWPEDHGYHDGHRTAHTRAKRLAREMFKRIPCLYGSG